MASSRNGERAGFEGIGRTGLLRNFSRDHTCCKPYAYCSGIFADHRNIFLGCTKRPAEDEWDAVAVIQHASGGKALHPAPCPPPQVFVDTYHTVVQHDVVVHEAVCLTSDLAVLGSASISGGDGCITGNVFVAGSVSIEGSTCVTGTVIVLGNAKAVGHVCITGDLFVKGDLAVKGKLKVDGKLCVFGSKDIQPDGH